MNKFVALLFVALTISSCGPNLNVADMGVKLSQSEIRDELIGKRMSFTGPNASVSYDMALSPDGVMQFFRVEESGLWFFAQEGTDICLRFVVRNSGDRSCFGISRLPEAGSYVTDHGYLIRLKLRPVE